MTPSERLDFCIQLFESQQPVKTGLYEYGKIIPVGEGKIDSRPKECSGVWGYEGDSVAIYVNGQPYPSRAIVHLNQSRLIKE